MLKFVVMDFSNYKGQYWSTGTGSLVVNRKDAKLFTVEQLVKHRSLHNYVRLGLVKIQEV